MSRKQRKSRKKSNSRVYFATISVVLVLVLSVQMVRLYQKNQEYVKQEEALNRELVEQQEKQQELADFEGYINSKEYVEDTAKEKLGMVYENEIIFREK